MDPPSKRSVEHCLFSIMKPSSLSSASQQKVNHLMVRACRQWEEAQSSQGDR